LGRRPALVTSGRRALPALPFFGIWFVGEFRERVQATSTHRVNGSR
jgi:hypothetical protein